MNRYKIILESEEFLANDEFEELVKTNMLHQSSSFKLVEAINLEGRRSSFPSECECSECRDLRNTF